MTRTKLLLSSLVISLLIGQSGCGGSSSDRGLFYVALGASETTGLNAKPLSEAYLYRIERRLREVAGEVSVLNLGVPGATLDAIARTTLSLAIQSKPDLVTLVTGSNDVVDGVNPELFESELAGMLSRLRQETSAMIALVTIPNLTSFPRFRQEPDPDVTLERISAFNDAILRQAQAFNVPVAAYDSATYSDDLVSSDGFHPSNAGHALAAELFLEIILPAFQ